jgi:hypothetical protein
MRADSNEGTRLLPAELNRQAPIGLMDLALAHRQHIGQPLRCAEQQYEGQMQPRWRRGL